MLSRTSVLARYYLTSQFLIHSAARNTFLTSADIAGTSKVCVVYLECVASRLELRLRLLLLDRRFSLGDLLDLRDFLRSPDLDRRFLSEDPLLLFRLFEECESWLRERDRLKRLLLFLCPLWQRSRHYTLTPAAEIRS